MIYPKLVSPIIMKLRNLSIIRIFLFASIASFIFNACVNSAYNIIDLSVELLVVNNNSIWEPVLNNDTILTESLRLKLNVNNIRIDDSKQCINFISNPIGALMSLTIFSEWCLTDVDILITSNNEFNGIPAGNSLNHIFFISNASNIDDFIDNYFKEPIESDNNVVEFWFHTTAKPNNPKQNFNIQLLTNKGNYQTETVDFYWF